MSTVQDAPADTITADPTSTGWAPFFFTAAAFDKIIEADVFADDDRVELWDGRITIKMAKTQAHAAAGINVMMTLVPILPPGWCLSSENPVALGPNSTPLPDFAILRGRGNDYKTRRPAPGDVGLLMELAVTSLKDDLGFRLGNYAAANIPVYWVLNLIDNVILGFERPLPAERRYDLAQTHTIGQTVPLRLDGALVAEIPVLDLLPVRG